MCDSSNPVIEAVNFHKFYGDTHAVKGLSFTVEQGEIYGLIGPDGGGKTSLIRSIVSLLRIEQGELYFQGKPVEQNIKFLRKQIGYMPQRFSLYQDLSVEENLNFFADLFGVSKAERKGKLQELYDFSGLEPFCRRKAGDLSGGMKQKLALSCMLIHSPGVIVLDEPTFGVDPLSRSEFWQILKKLRTGGTSILVSTAYMDEAAYCDRVGLMFQGKMLVQDRPENLSRLFHSSLYQLLTPDVNKAYITLQNSGLCSFCQLFGEGPHLCLSENTGKEQLCAFLTEKGISYVSLEQIEPGIEDVFLKLMQELPHDSD